MVLMRSEPLTTHAVRRFSSNIMELARKGDLWNSGLLWVRGVNRSPAVTARHSMVATYSHGEAALEVCFNQRANIYASSCYVLHSC